ncbi:MAG: efflux RND transporter permease subunit [Planctomycetes bacterium]|nr:efflux RND transporter permease subunit [Planctomycetota bacterium]
MISAIIEFSVRNRFLVLLLVGAVSLWGVYCLYRTPIDAIPDLSENQVIVWADWEGRSPKELEDQVTYPLSVNLQGLAGVKSIRATSEFGFSMINVIFDDSIDFYFSRQRVLERLSIAGSFLPPGVVPYLAPDATALGQIFWYTIEGEGKGLDELRAIQDWDVRYPLNAVPGVAQVASVGGFVREYQIDVDPNRLRAYDLGLGQVFRAVLSSNSSVGGKVVHKGGSEYLVRGVGWLRGVEDVSEVVVAERGGIPITVGRLGAVQLGPAFRRSVLEKGGCEAVGGVVMMRYGENPLAVTERIKARIAELQPGLPAGVRIVPFYDRTALIHASIDTLAGTLVEEIVIASLVVYLVLQHARSALVICSTLPLAVLVSFIFMYYLGVPSNIMSLSGIAISIGVLVDAGIVMTENAYHRLHDHFPDGRVTGDTRPLVLEACKVVGGPLFFSILIMLLSFAPIFVLGGIEGKMFHPLAFTKSFALVGVAVLAITLVPALIPTFVRGRLRSQEDVWLVRSFADIYRPMLSFFLSHPDAIVVLTGVFLVSGLPLFPQKVPWIFFVAGVPFLIAVSTLLVARRPLVCLVVLFVAALGAFRLLHPLGEEFMPPLDELAIMDMPVTTPNANITQAGDDLKERDALLLRFPEVHQVVGKAGRADTPTDPAPVDMVETVVSLRPRGWWPRRKVNFGDTLATARTAREALEHAGFLRARPERRLELSKGVAGAIRALDLLLAAPAPEPGRRVLALDALTDAAAALGADRHEDAASLALAADVFLAAPRVGAPRGEIPSPEAWRYARGVLTGPAAADALGRALDEHDEGLVNAAAMEAATRFDRHMRELCMRRLREHVPAKARELLRLLRTRVTELLRTKGALRREVSETAWIPFDEQLAAEFGAAFDEWVLAGDVGTCLRRIVDKLAADGAVEPRPDLLVEPETPRARIEELLGAVTGQERPSLALRWRAELEARHGELMIERVRQLNWELQDRAPGTLAWCVLEELVASASTRRLAGREAAAGELVALRAELETREPLRELFLWQKLKSDVVQEMDSELQVPGWGNIWTQPIINRVDMLATGVRTMIGVKVFGDDLEKIQRVSEEIAAVMKRIRGAVDVFPDQVVGENYLEVQIDRRRAARYGASVEAIQDVIEVALGGKEITMTVEGRRRFPVRVRYPRDLREDEEAVKTILVPVGGGEGDMAPGGEGQDGMNMAGGAAPASAATRSLRAGAGGRARLRQVPLSQVADVRIRPGPSMIKSENGSLRAYVQLNVRDRDIVGFVEEAKQAVESRVKLPPGFHLEWSGQFEHQMRAQKTLTVVFPLVLVVIFVLLYVTYRDLPDTLMMFLAVPGAVAGGALFQWLWGYNFSVAVWVGYIACFGLATETGIVMLVYLRESIERRGGIGKISSEAEIREAVMEGAVQRLRPKLLTEGTTILALIPMLWATGVGAEFMRPMAAPILGGILVADEVIDIFLPVLFYWERRRRLRARLAGETTEPRA